MNTNSDSGPCYEFEAVYHYSDGERYNTGNGLSVMSEDLTHLKNTFEVFKNGGEPYAITICRLDTGEILSSHGDMAAAKQSSAKAYRLRYTAA